MSEKTSTPTTDFIKPLVGGLTAGILDNMWLMNKDMTSNGIFAVTVAGGLYGSQMISTSLPSLIPTSVLSNAKTIQQRLLEIGAGAGSSYVVNKYVLNNEGYSRDNMMKKLAIIVASDIIGEYASDFMNTRELSYFI